MKSRKPFEKLSYVRSQTTSDDVSEDGASSADSDENKVRGNWSRQVEFFLSCVSYAVGPGNIWRFPYVCMRNGGGAFLIPYFTMMLLCAIPMIYLEFALGQFSSCSAFSVWKIAPFFQGLGVASVVVNTVVTLYFNVTFSWILYYFIHSFTTTLPWGTCDNWWNTENCLARHAVTGVAANATMRNETLHVPFTSEGTPEYTFNDTLPSNGSRKFHTPAEEFWHYNVLGISSGIEDVGGMQWKLVGANLACWIIVFLCLFKGVKTSGKAVYVTATLPYVFLSVLLVRGLTLPGSLDGVLYFITPDWPRLLEFEVWVEACLQIFFSCGPAWGTLIMLASYNRFHNRVHIDAALVPMINCGTSFFAGFVIFSIIGFMARDAGVHVKDVITSGPGLAFVAYPEALNRLPISPLWAVMFFLMMLNLTLGTQLASVETISTGFMDKFPQIMKFFKKKWALTLCIVFVMFLSGLIFLTRAGIYFFQVCDWYVAALSLQVIGALECVVVGTVYGIKRFSYDIECMIGSKPNLVMQAMWLCVTPLLITVILSLSMVKFPVPTYGDYRYPAWAISAGWTLAGSSLVPIVFYMVWTLLSAKGSLLKRFRSVLRPASNWGPALEQHRVEYKYNLALSSPDNLVEERKLHADSVL